jgi:hypothetical protein
MGFFQLVVGSTVPTGRGMMIINPAKQDSSKYSRKSLVRVCWYVIHAALELEGTQRYGLMAVTFPKHAKFSQFDRHLDAMIMESIKGCLPAHALVGHSHLSAAHILSCYFPHCQDFPRRAFAQTRSSSWWQREPHFRAAGQV